MRILVAGDTHASPNAARQLTHLVKRHEADEIWQCGDLGYWPHAEFGRRFIKQLEEVPVPMYFADGNHEYHPDLLHDAHAEYELSPNLWYVPRGRTRLVNGTRVLFLGGARSVDRTYRTPGLSWFPEELPTSDQMERARQPADIIISHEGPSWVDFGYPPNHLAPWPMVDLEVSQLFRKQMDEVAAYVRPSLWFHGHHHVYKETVQNGTVVYSLGESSQDPAKWCVVLDLDTVPIQVSRA